MRPECRCACLIVTALHAFCVAVIAAEPPLLSPADVEFFEKRVRPVLADRCFGCHGPDNVESGLRLDSLAATLKGGTRGPALVPKEPKTSLLILAVNHADQLHMPPKSKIPQREIDGFTEWVQRGAFWPGSDAAAAAAAASRKTREITAEDRNFWSLRPVTRHALPAVKQPGWVRTPIDAFILSRLEAAGLAPAPPAQKRTLIRRATLDLTGLPPTPDEVADFLADDSPDAFEKLVDRLLASPRYGQRWGRHWLDVARYGDSNGLDENLAFGNAWRYRDYVVDALNADLPYDQFLAEQIAGDLMPSDDPAVQRRRIAATGFLALGAKMLAEDDPVKMEMDIIDEQVDTLGRAVLGLTFGCARCHDHKFDPLLQTDYYSLAGIFKSTKTMDTFSVVARWQERPLATPSELRQRDAAMAVVNEVKKQLDAVIAGERDRVLGDVRRQTAAYLLAAYREERLLGRPAAVTLAPEGDVTRLPGAKLIEAEQFDRGNVHKDFSSYGKGIGVLVNKGETPNFVEYDIDVPAAGLYQLDLRYAAADRRRCSLSVNGAVLKRDAAGQVTGGWEPDSQKWLVEGVVSLNAGKNVLRLEHPKFFPHIDKLLLFPATDDRVPAEVTAEIEAAPLIPEIVSRWRTTLAQESAPFAAWRHRAKQTDWTGFDRKSDPLAELLLGETPPTRLLELAKRYAAALGESSVSPPVAEAHKLLRSDKGPWSPAAVPETTFTPAARDSLTALRDRLATAEKGVPQFAEAMAVSEGAPTNLRIHLRGSHVTLGDATTRRFPTVLDQGHDPAVAANESGRRQLAQWLGDPANPLTSRVLVNRLWQHHFGEGLVRSPDNFGRLGEPPTHPELLDWLAAEIQGPREATTSALLAPPLRKGGQGGSRGTVVTSSNVPTVPETTGLSDNQPASNASQPLHPTPPAAPSEGGVPEKTLAWSLKRLHRTILLSSAWQQSTVWNERANLVDPENRLLWRMSRRPLEAEAIRDSILFVGGSLDETFGGSLLPTKNRAYVTSTANVNPAIYVSHRRTIYLPVVRSAVYDFLVAFDFGDPSAMQGKRDRTTVAPQALFLMNSAVVSEQSKAIAARLIEQPEPDADRVGRLFETLLSRTATPKEIDRALAFVARYPESLPAAEGAADAKSLRLRAWQAVCRALIASNEFLYVE